MDVTLRSFHEKLSDAEIEVLIKKWIRCFPKKVTSRLMGGYRKL